jgi:hypothetical protein
MRGFHSRADRLSTVIFATMMLGEVLALDEGAERSEAIEVAAEAAATSTALAPEARSPAQRERSNRRLTAVSARHGTDRAPLPQCRRIPRCRYGRRLAPRAVLYARCGSCRACPGGDGPRSRRQDSQPGRSPRSECRRPRRKPRRFPDYHVRNRPELPVRHAGTVRRITAGRDQSTYRSEHATLFNSVGELIPLVDTNGDGGADSNSIVFSGLPGVLTGLGVAGNLVFVTSSAFGQERISVLRMGTTPADPFSFIGALTFAFPSNWEHTTYGLAGRPTPGQAGTWDLFFNLESRESEKVGTTCTG